MYRFTCDCRYPRDSGRCGHPTWLSSSPEPQGCPECGEPVEPSPQTGGVDNSQKDAGLRS